MTIVKQKQPLLAVSLDNRDEDAILLPQDLDTIVKRQTDALLKS